MMPRIAVLVFALLGCIVAHGAHAQQVGSGCTPIGRGAGVTGFYSDCAAVGGTANAIILTPTLGAVPATISKFTRLIFQATATNNGPTTIRYGASGPGPYTVFTNGGSALVGTELINGSWYIVGFDPALNGGAGGWRLLNGNTTGGGSGITTLTGDVTASGFGAVIATLATVNANVGSFGSSTAIPVFTVNAKGLITAAATNPVIAPAGTLTGGTLAAGVLASSLNSVGTLTGGATGAGFTINLGTSTVVGNLDVSHLNSGTGASSLSFWRGDGTWASPAGSGNVTSSVTLTANRLVLGNGTTDLIVMASAGTGTTLLHGGSPPTYSSVVSADLNITTTGCTNQFVTAISAGGVGTCTTDTLASAQHANQGTTVTVLHGNAAGNPSWSSVVSADLNITTTSCSANNFVSAISAGGVGTCTSGPGWVLLNTLTASASSTLSDTTSITSTYNEYEIVFEDLLPTTTATQPVLQVFSGGAYQTTGYHSAILAVTSGAVTGAASSTTYIYLSTAVTSTAAEGSLTGYYRLFNPSNTTAYKSWIGSVTYSDGTTTNQGSVFGKWRGGTGAVTGFRVFFGTLGVNTIASGVIKIYGRV